MREIESLNACFQSVMKASYVMKAARHACTHNHSCILLGYGLLLLRVWTCTVCCTIPTSHTCTSILQCLYSVLCTLHSVLCTLYSVTWAAVRIHSDNTVLLNEIRSCESSLRPAPRTTAPGHIPVQCSQV